MHDDAMRYAFFSKAALEYMLKTNKRPDVIHCHDWQTALVPVLLFEIYKYHGMDEPARLPHHSQLRPSGRDWRRSALGHGTRPARILLSSTTVCRTTATPALNLLKGGIVYSNFVTTVSPHHAWEVMNTDQGLGLAHTLWIHRGKFGGVLNGVDYDVWNPEVDPSSRGITPRLHRPQI